MERAQEERKKREEERRAEREKGLLDMPRAGTVKYEDLVKLAKCVAEVLPAMSAVATASR